MAGMLSKSHVIGVIGPIDVGDAQLYVDGFKAGVLAQDPKATVHVSFTGSFSDVIAHGRARPRPTWPTGPTS